MGVGQCHDRTGAHELIHYHYNCLHTQNVVGEMDINFIMRHSHLETDNPELDISFAA